MKFNKNVVDHLKGERFSNGLQVPIANNSEQLYSRRDYIIKKIKNKRVIHLGCCDHLPLIDDKIGKNTWMHKHVMENSKYCLGVDINKEAVNYIKTRT